MLILGAAPAQAATTTTHPYLFSFAPPSGEFLPSGVAIHNASGRVYVTDRANNVVQVFDAAGNKIGEMDGAEAPFGPFQLSKARGIAGVAVDNSGGASDGRIYVSSGDNGDDMVAAFRPNGSYVHFFSRFYGHNPIALLQGGSPTALSVADDGTLAVASGNKPLVERFSPLGAALGVLPLSTAGGEDLEQTPSRVAYDSHGAIYVTFRGARTIKVDREGQLEAIIEPPINQGGAGVAGIAVDRRSDDLYTLAREGGVGALTRRDSEGNVLGRFGLGKVAIADKESDSSGQLIGWRYFSGMAVNEKTGRIYVASSDGQVAVFGPATSVTVADAEIDPASDLTDTGATLNGRVDPSGTPTSYRFEYRRVDEAEQWKATPLEDAGSGTGETPVEVSITGLSQNTTYEVRLVTTNTDNGAVQASETITFTTTGLPQAEVTIAEPEVTATTAHFEGTVNPKGDATSWRFEYSTDSKNWTQVKNPECDPDPECGAGSGNSPVAVEADLSGLIPNQDYFVRLVATNSGGPKKVKEDFKTVAVKAEILDRFVAPRTQTSARLNALITPNNAAATYYVEYGTSESYGQRFPAEGGLNAGNTMKQELRAAELKGLQPDTTYHYRFVAVNVAGEQHGEDRTFKTRSPEETGPPQRGIELVNNPRKGNQAVNLLDLAGNKALWSVNGGAPGSPAGARGAFLAERTPTGWKSESVLPPIDRLFGGGSQRFELLIRSAALDRFIFTAVDGVIAFGVPTLVEIGPNQSQRVLITLAEPPTDSVNVVTANGYTSDFSHVFFATALPLSAGHDNGIPNIYDFSTEPPSLVSRMPGGSPPGCGVDVTFSSREAHHFGSGNYGWSSSVGSPTRVFFQTSGDSCGDPSQLYVRDLSQATAEPISGAPLSGSLGQAYFIRTNPTGSEALFVTPTKLDPDDSNTSNDIYKWTAGEGSECLTCVVVEAGVAAEPSAVPVVAPADLSRVYFVSQRNLVPGLDLPGRKIYVVRDGEIELVSSVAAAAPFLKEGTSGDGRSLVFASDAREVTSDDNGGERQLYIYDEDDGSVECVSCPDTASPPALASAPSNPSSNSAHAVISADGKSVVFQTEGRLLPEDVNNSDDVYEWRDGKLRLVTDGETIFPSGVGALQLRGITRDGANIFFQAGANLTGYETDSMPQAYAAHRGGGFPPPSPPPARCDGDSCQGPLVSEPPLGSAASSTFVGPGNQGQRAKKKQAKKKKGKGRAAKRCAKSKGKKAAKCKEKRKRAAKGKGRAGR